MPTYTPASADITGSFTLHPRDILIIDSTYGGLGGTYGVLYWDYGGFQIHFTPRATDISASFTPASTSTGSFTPASNPAPGVYVPS